MSNECFAFFSLSLYFVLMLNCLSGVKVISLLKVRLSRQLNGFQKFINSKWILEVSMYQGALLRL